MAIKSSYQTVAEQIITYNTNSIELLSKLNELALSSDPSLTINVMDKSGISSQLNLPSFGFLKSEILRLSNNIESIFNINGSGSLIQTSNNVYKKVIAVDLNKEPNDVTTVESVANFTISKNWFFDSLLNPQLFVELDLSGKVEDNVTSCKVRRYIVEFDDIGGELTTNGSSALSAFNNIYRNRSNIVISEFVNWVLTTPGIKDASNVNYDEQDFDMEANKLSYNGQYSVLKVEEDTLNNILWYHLDTLKYVNTLDNSLSQLSIGMELILNISKSSTRYKIIDVSTSMVNPRVRLERIEGIDPIPVGVGTLKVYSTVFHNKKVRISVGYNERNVLFIKPINTDNHIMSKNWSGGIGYWTNDLKLKSNDGDNGMSMSQYYVTKVSDYGTVLRDLTKKNIPNLYAIKPIAPKLILGSFKVVQINKHLTDTNGSSALKAKNSQLVSLKSEIAQLNDAIIIKNKQLITTRFSSESTKNQFENDLVKLNKKKESNSKLLGSLVSDIIAATNEVNSSDVAKYKVRGFWDIPLAATAMGTPPQEIVQFRVRYRYLTIDGREQASDTYNLTSNGTRTTAVFANWNTMLTDPRRRIYDVTTDSYSWEIVNVGDGNMINTNQLNLSINPNESIEIMVKSISEVGYPESLVESDWSLPMIIEFPNELNVGTIDIETIKLAAIREDIKTQIESDFAAKGLDSHLSDTTVVNNKIYDHRSEKILSGFKDVNNVDLDLFSYLKSLQLKIEQLEAKINKVSGELEVVMYRNNDQLIIKNGAEITYNVECEDYLDSYTATGVQTGRVYANSIYVIKDFLLKIKNKSSESPLGLLSSRNYSSADIYNTSAPQNFWVNDQNEIITSNVTGETKTQLDNQFVWMVNYEGITQSSAVKLSDNIGNNFVVNKSNSITNILSSSDFNLGYSEKTTLSFINNNNSLLDSSKWVDPSSSIASTTKLLSTVHPVVSDLENIVEVNSSKVKTIGLNDNDDVNIPLNLYFKMNALDNTKTGINYQYINLNNSTQSVKHIKKVKFLMESESDNRPFMFTVVFVLNRNKTIVKKTTSSVPSMTDSLQDVSTKQRRSKTSTYKPNIKE